MIAYIKGRITYKNPTHIYLETGGIGYMVYVSLNTYTLIQSLNEVKLFIHPYFMKEAQSLSGIALYGFHDEKERELFQHLISISGVGASSATVALSAMTPDELIIAITSEDEAKVKSIKGVGPKTAKRIILELKDKLAKMSTDGVISPKLGNTVVDEALSALVALGFSKPMAEKALKRAMNLISGQPSVEALIKQSLKLL